MTIGAIAAVTIALFAMTPQGIAGLMLIAGALLTALIDFLARRTPYQRIVRTSRPLGVAVLWIITLAIVLISSLVIVWTVVRANGSYWLAYLLAAIVFTTVLSGIWLDTRRSTAR